MQQRGTSRLSRGCSVMHWVPFLMGQSSHKRAGWEPQAAGMRDHVQEIERYTKSLRELVLIREALAREVPLPLQSGLQDSHLDSLELAGLDEDVYVTDNARAGLCIWYTVPSTQASATPSQALSLLHRCVPAQHACHRKSCGFCALR